MEYPKHKPIRLKGKALQDLKRACIERDEYCVYSGSPYNLQVHHCVLLSQGGSDTLDNIVTVCAEVHDMLHNGKLKIINNKGNWKFKSHAKKKSPNR